METHPIFQIIFVLIDLHFAAKPDYFGTLRFPINAAIEVIHVHARVAKFLDAIETDFGPRLAHFV